MASRIAERIEDVDGSAGGTGSQPGGGTYGLVSSRGDDSIGYLVHTPCLRSSSWNSVVVRRKVDEEEQLKKTGKRILIGASVLLTLAILAGGYSQFGWIFYRHHSTACQQRGKAYEARIETLKHDARERLRIGTPKEDVMRFFKENGLPVSLHGDEYEGTIYTDGCAPAGCGSDAALLGLRVKADSSGAVAGEPIVGALYTNCL